MAELGEEARGSIQAGYRPVVVIQNNKGNFYSPTTIVAPVTSCSKTNLPVHVTVSDHCVFRKTSIIMLEQIRTINKTDLNQFMGTLPEDVMREVDRKIGISLGLIPIDSRPRERCL